MRRSTPFALILILFSAALMISACAGGSSQEEQTEALQPTPTLVSVGSIPEKPVPYGYDIILQDLVISINGVTRPADSVVNNVDASTPTPENGQEYMLVRITNQCVKMGFDDCFVSPADYQLLDNAGNMLAPLSATSGLEGFFSFQEFSIGTSNQGYLAFLVEKDTAYPLMAYRTFQGENVYLALNY